MNPSYQLGCAQRYVIRAFERLVRLQFPPDFLELQLFYGISPARNARSKRHLERNCSHKDLEFCDRRALDLKILFHLMLSVNVQWGSTATVTVRLALMGRGSVSRSSKFVAFEKTGYEWLILCVNAARFSGITLWRKNTRLRLASVALNDESASPCEREGI